MKAHIYLLTYLLTCIMPYIASAQPEANFGDITIVVHGGAGNIIRGSLSAEKELAYKQKIEEALEAGYAVLEQGGSSVEAVTVAIRIMEDSPLFNAGKGAVFNHEGINELDASIMDGKNNAAGAVAGVTTIRNPINAARMVMENSPHVLLTGEGAEAFAKEQGLEIVSPSYFYTEERYKHFQDLKDSQKSQLDHSKDEGSIKHLPNIEKFGTVGAVALDKDGNLAAGTSTGGMTNKKYGRVGDSPIIGSSKLSGGLLDYA